VPAPLTNVERPPSIASICRRGGLPAGEGVTDKKGNPVHGLNISDFRISDNNKPQEIASFEEHHKDETTPVLQPVLAPGVYSNGYLAQPPPVLNILFLDLTNISIEDQMYVAYQLGKFFDGLQPSDQVAIAARRRA
jgi:VWFA-related protein